jgi:hypothetical protein
MALVSRGLPTSASVLLITDEVVPRLLVPPRPDRALLTVAPGTLGTAFTPPAAGEDTALSQLSGHVRPSPRLPVWTGNIELRGTGIAPGLYAGVWQNGCVRRGVCVCATSIGPSLPFVCVQPHPARRNGETDAALDDRHASIVRLCVVVLPLSASTDTTHRHARVRGNQLTRAYNPAAAAVPLGARTASSRPPPRRQRARATGRRTCSRFSRWRWTARTCTWCSRAATRRCSR